MDNLMIDRFGKLATKLDKYELSSDINKFYVVERGMTTGMEPSIYEATASSLIRQTMGGLDPDNIIFIGNQEGAQKVYDAAMIGHQAIKDAINA
jgi:hypothetical protein